MTTRFRSLLWLCLALPVFSTGSGCSCDPSLATTPVDMGMPDMYVPPTCDAPGQWCTPAGASDQICVVPDDATLCSYDVVGYNLGTCPPASVQLDTATCTFRCGATPGADCIPPDPLKPGYLSQYIDSVTVPDGSGGEYVAISGYSPGWLDISNLLYRYGDLVYVEYRQGDPEELPQTSYVIVDGKPADSANNIYSDPAGWRGGNSEAGDDVGYYSSIAASASGDVYIAYLDKTTPGNYRLKLAHRVAGQTTWAISVIDDSDRVKRYGALYPSLTLNAAGNLVVAYGVRDQAAAPGQDGTGWVRVATSSNANPAAVADWAYADLTETTANVGCVDGDGLCATGDRCVADGFSGRGTCMTPTSDCTTTCSGMFGSQSICSNGACRDVRGAGDLPDAVGMFNNLVRDGNGLALAYHDRGAGALLTGQMCTTDANCANTQAFCSGAIAGTPNSGTCMIPNGNIWGVRFDGTTWGSRFLIDGYSRKQATVGDCGQHLTFTIDSTGVWHVAYLDGTFDRIRYAQVQTNNTVNNYAFVDDGTAAFAPALTDRLDGNRRLVGGEMGIQISASNEIRILYQDLTGPQSIDPLVQPVGAQPLLAVRAMGATTFTVTYAGTPGPNSGFWASQSLGTTGTTNNTSYCIWAQRAANSNDPTTTAVEDGAMIHVVECR